jgi:hypothetical protein
MFDFFFVYVAFSTFLFFTFFVGDGGGGESLSSKTRLSRTSIHRYTHI